jgi:exo-beta-1,3-glucanase (GH17 family)
MMAMPPRSKTRRFRQGQAINSYAGEKSPIILVYFGLPQGVIMIRFFLLLLSLLLMTAGTAGAADKKTAHRAPPPLQCVAFSPYVGTINPDYGPSPPKELIDTLLDKIVKETPFRCIMTYGVLNGLDYTFTAAQARHLKVIAILWLDKDSKVNSQSISTGIHLAKTFADTIIKLSCGSEVRTRHGYQFDGEISRCLQALREAKVTQPITTIDTWWEWCNRSLHCEKTLFSDQVDWIGINIFPWWENTFSPLHSCTPAGQAADFHLARLHEVRTANPNKAVMITEFGWPNGPAKAESVNVKTGQRCGVASAENQALVVQSTFKKLAQEHLSGTVFEAFSENWKPSNEGDFGKYWGICQGEPPFACSKKLTHP